MNADVSSTVIWYGKSGCVKKNIASLASVFDPFIGILECFENKTKLSGEDDFYVRESLDCALKFFFTWKITNYNLYFKLYFISVNFFADSQKILAIMAYSVKFFKISQKK